MTVVPRPETSSGTPLSGPPGGIPVRYSEGRAVWKAAAILR